MGRSNFYLLRVLVSSVTVFSAIDSTVRTDWPLKCQSDPLTGYNMNTKLKHS